MKSKIILALLIMLLAGSGMANAEEGQIAEGMKIGWIDLDQVFRGYHKTEKVLSDLEKSVETKEDEIKKVAQKIETLEQEKFLLSESGRREKEEEINEQKIALIKLQRESEIDLNQKVMTEKGKLLDEILEIVAKKAEAEGYTFIFRKALMVYADPDLELTEDILEELNKEGVEESAVE